jgi:hypothetical protein
MPSVPSPLSHVNRTEKLGSFAIPNRCRKGQKLVICRPQTSENRSHGHLPVKGVIIGSPWHFQLMYPNGVQG